MPRAQFDVWDVSRWEIFSDETEGVEEKYWLIDPLTEQRWLFKPPVVNAVNGPEAGWHLRLLAHLSIAVPDGSEVFVDDRWQPAGKLIQSAATRVSAGLTQPANVVFDAAHAVGGLGGR